MQREITLYLEELRQDMIADHNRLRARLEDLLETVIESESESMSLIDEIAERHRKGQTTLASALTKLASQLSAPMPVQQVQFHPPPIPPQQRDEKFGPYNGGAYGHG